jgi:hypothetical protein
MLDDADGGVDQPLALAVVQFAADKVGRWDAPVVALLGQVKEFQVARPGAAQRRRGLLAQLLPAPHPLRLGRGLRRAGGRQERLDARQRWCARSDDAPNFYEVEGDDLDEVVVGPHDELAGHLGDAAAEEGLLLVVIVVRAAGGVGLEIEHLA